MASSTRNLDRMISTSILITKSTSTVNVLGSRWDSAVLKKRELFLNHGYNGLATFKGPPMARVINIVPSWEHRSVYWKTIVRRQFVDDNRVFVYLKNKGISEIFCIGRPCLRIDRLEKAQIDKFLLSGNTTSSQRVTAKAKCSKMQPRVHSKGGVASPKRASNRNNKILSGSTKSKISVANRSAGIITSCDSRRIFDRPASGIPKNYRASS